jgi:DNA-binding NarL/FixJ family response regulator
VPIRIVLDDHPIVLGGLHQLLSLESDLTVVARCTNGTDALAAVRRERPDILIADLTMPGFTGLELLREVAAAALPVKVILLTARIDHEEVLEAMKHGVAGIVLKESAPLQILDCIRRVTAGEQWIDQVIGRRTIDGMLRRQASAERAASVLTARELEVVRMVARGLSNKEIADSLSISEGTVKSHLRAIFEKLGVSSRMKLSVYAREQMLV